MKTPRVVLDNNILLSALLFQSGSLSWLRSAWQNEKIIPLASHDTIKEFIRVLVYPKFRLYDNERDDLLSDYLPWCETIVIEITPDIPYCRDQFDRPFLELAFAGNADALISGDKDLRVLAPSSAVPILSATEFQQHFTNISL